MVRSSWIVVGGALLVAAAAFYLLVLEDGDGGASDGRAVMDDIDAQSRAEMRSLLREADGQE
jgi:hypothetical protein